MFWHESFFMFFIIVVLVRFFVNGDTIVVLMFDS